MENRLCANTNALVSRLSAKSGKKFPNCAGVNMPL